MALANVNLADGIKTAVSKAVSISDLKFLLWNLLRLRLFFGHDSQIFLLLQIEISILHKFKSFWHFRKHN